MATHDRSILEAALIGYQQQVQGILTSMEEIRTQLGQRKTRPVQDQTDSEVAAPARKKRTMSAAARKRIAEAQKKRWAEYHKQHAA